MENSGHEIIKKERLRQIIDLGYKPLDDLKYVNSELISAAHVYATPHQFRNLGDDDVPLDFPWNKEFFKPTPNDRIKELAKAGALIAAEIDRELLLIEQDNPKNITEMNREYLFINNMVYEKDSSNPIPVKEPFIVNNVIHIGNGSFLFTDPKTGVIYETSYAWTLVLNTPKNIHIWGILGDSYKNVEKAKRINKKLQKQIITANKKI